MTLRNRRLLGILRSQLLVAAVLLFFTSCTTAMIEVGQPAPPFSLYNEKGEKVSLNDHRGKFVLLIFYPGDNTPVCTKQLCEYRDSWDEFQSRDVVLLGISSDGVSSHASFINKHNFPFPLLSDPERTMIRQYGVEGMFGMTKRAYTFISPEGKVLYSDNDALPIFKKSSKELLTMIDSFVRSR